MREAYDNARRDHNALTRIYRDNQALFRDNRLDYFQLTLVACRSNIMDIHNVISAFYRQDDNSTPLPVAHASLYDNLSNQVEKLLEFRMTCDGEFEATLLAATGLSITNLLNDFIDSVNQLRETTQQFIADRTGEEKADAEEKEEKSAATAAPAISIFTPAPVILPGESTPPPTSPATPFISFNCSSDEESGDESDDDDTSHPNLTAPAA
ncbi:MAG: hypothetical protein P1U40_00560 [Coxiellaceae bacterium]|nr:hypothetical protein [Coxiellaceae bacterium]